MRSPTLALALALLAGCPAAPGASPAAQSAAAQPGAAQPAAAQPAAAQPGAASPSAAPVAPAPAASAPAASTSAGTVAPAPAASASAAPVAPAPATAPAGRARLVVLLVIDQLPQWAFEAKRPALRDGFDRLLREGAWHTGQHPSAATLTAPGHALLGTGEPTATSGIVANEWWNRDAERVLHCTEGLDGARSAGWLRVPALGDALAAANTGARAISISLKDRAAILPLGRAGTAIWYDKRAVAWTGTKIPPWLAAHDRAHPISAHLRHVWTPLAPDRLAALSGTKDNARGEVGEKGFGPTFPHAVAATRDPADALYATPLGNQLVLDLALAAIDGERLGRDDAPDLLVLSLSSHDYIGHGWGQESWEMWDTTLRLDRQLAGFLRALDDKIGPGAWAMVVTSDHGAAPMPERMGGGRIAFESLAEAANRAASLELGPGQWIAAAKYPSVYLTAAARAKPTRELQRALAKVIHALRAFPGIARVERTA
ncbi:MAG: alkaline phosphatase family protein, partial [Kofleriaceae bacterium]